MTISLIKKDHQMQKQSIDGVYVEGISLTLGSPRKHMCTYAAGLSNDHNHSDRNCPCATFPGASPPAFVGNDYYCESGNTEIFDQVTYHLSDPLWDGIMAVALVMVVVLELECLGSIGNCNKDIKHLTTYVHNSNDLGKGNIYIYIHV